MTNLLTLIFSFCFLSQLRLKTFNKRIYGDDDDDDDDDDGDEL